MSENGQTGNSNSNNHSLQQRSAEEPLWTHQTLKQKSYSSRTHTPVSLLSHEDSKLRLQFTQTHQTWTVEEWKTLPW